MNFWLNNRFGIATTTTAQKAKWGVFKLSKHHQISTFSKKKSTRRSQYTFPSKRQDSVGRGFRDFA